MREIQVGDALIFNNGGAFGCVLVITKDSCFVKFQKDPINGVFLSKEIVRLHIVEEKNAES